VNLYVWPSLLLIAALLLVFLEVFVPSAGVIQLLALGLLGASLWSAFAVSTMTGFVFLTISLALLPIVLLFAASLWPHTWVARYFMLMPPETDERPGHSDDSPFADLQLLVGQVGRALTDLRPCGTVEIHGNPVDAMTDEGYLPAGIPVRAIGIKQAQLLVRRYEV